MTVLAALGWVALGGLMVAGLGFRWMRKAEREMQSP